jgi:hypothetical protein
MIISASRRTDIPAYYSAWFMNRIRRGFAFTRTPFRPSQTSRVSLEPADVDGIVFWTRNADPLIPYLDELDGMGFRYYFQYTVVHYPRVFEPSTGSISEKIERFSRLSEKVGTGRIIWRYDPIILGSLTDQRYHYDTFQEIAEALSGFTRRCIISFLDIYPKRMKTLNNLEREKGIIVTNIHDQEATVRDLSKFIGEIGGNHGFEVVTCAEPFDLEAFGIGHGKCIDDELLNRLFGLDLSISKDRGQRKLCRCVESKDIGAYDTCPHGCIYCYANSGPKAVQKNFDGHEPATPLLP